MKLQISRIGTWFIRYIQIQLFITLVSLPILVYWGLPISAMSIVSNLIFTPFLMLFLLVASLIFFSELLGIPNQWLITVLEKITGLWETILTHGSGTWLISFAKPSVLFFLLVLISAFTILHAKKLHTKTGNILWLAFLLGVTLGYLKIFTRETTPQLSLECNNGLITILCTNNQITIIDPGVIGQRSSTASWLEYTLLSELNKRFGTSTIDHLIIMQPGKQVFEHIQHLCQCTQIKKLYLVYWQGQADKRLLQRYGALWATLKKTNTSLHRIGYKKEHIFLNAKDSLVITPLQTNLAYNTISFPALHITGTIENHSIDIYPKKLKNHKITSSFDTLIYAKARSDTSIHCQVAMAGRQDEWPKNNIDKQRLTD